jgi:predicted O-methyltransferase YrrM
LQTSTNEHGIHSPFVYNFITKCLYNKTPITDSDIKEYRENLLSNNNLINITDFGAGSKVFKSNERSISAIAKTAGISIKRANLLAKITKYFGPNKILEIGTSLGMATAAMAFGNPSTKIITLEGCPETAQVAKEYFQKFHLNNIELNLGAFKDTLPILLKKNTYDLIFFDGNDKKEGTIDYFIQCLLYKQNDTIFIFDDIHWSREMEVAWDFIIDHKEVTISIDTYQWGIVFFRKEQLKEHYTIRV